MDKMIIGKFIRTDSVVGIMYSPAIEKFFKEKSTGAPGRARTLPNGQANLYPVNEDIKNMLDIPNNPRQPLHPQDGNINLNFLRAEGLGNPREFEDYAEIAVQKWRPENAKGRDRWLEFLADHGFDEENPPKPPGIVIRGCEAKYSNSALEDVMASVKRCANKIYQEYIQPTELSFKVEVSNE